MEELSWHIMDIARNSLEAGATYLKIVVDEHTADNQLRFMVQDNGPGMPDYVQKRLLDPFFTTKTGKKVGLGLPLLQAAVERCGGSLEIWSRPGTGTRVTAVFPYFCWDRPPLGDIPRTLTGLLAGQESLHLYYRQTYDGREFIFDTAEVRAYLQGLPLVTPGVLVWLNQYLGEGINSLYGGGRNEIARRAG
ncbi:ATP-binding protein [Desulfurispora thermophila]|uniref:ATP-binding protein n=1 Tax=Desulfurispora thermophila TaxID=265470 RepID=UPI000367DCE2|nr:ATP-binding protein [Desulfurispora thermophila]